MPLLSLAAGTHMLAGGLPPTTDMSRETYMMSGALPNPGERTRRGKRVRWQRNTAVKGAVAETAPTPASLGVEETPMRELPPEPFEDAFAPPKGTHHFGGEWLAHGVGWGGSGKEPGGSVGAPSAERSGFRLGFRLRRRGRLTNCLEQTLKDSQGRWSDLAETGVQSRARAWLSGYVSSTECGKIEPGEFIFGSRKEEGRDHAVPTVTPTVWVPFVGDNKDVRALLVSPELVAELAKRRIFRAATSVLLGSLRGRAAVWADERGISAMDLVRVLPGSIALAILPMPDEVTALAALRGAAGEYSSTVLASLEKGVLRAPSAAPLGTYLRRPLAWMFAAANTRLLAPGVGTLVLPA